MGKVEKVVVLSVLFLIAVILVVSLTLDDPLDKEKVTIAGDSGTRTAALPVAATQEAPKPVVTTPASAPATVAAVPAADVKPASAAPSALLSANVEPPKPETPAIEARASIPVGSILKTVDGLTDSYLPEMKFYTWQSGDSLRAIATKYYGDATKITILRRSNEGRTEVQPGEKILVPVYDGDAPETSAPETASANPAPSAAPTSAPAATKSASGTRTHIVKEGESLWKIAKQELGSGARWKEIYEANRDVLATPDAVHAGLRLRIP